MLHLGFRKDVSQIVLTVRPAEALDEVFAVRKIIFEHPTLYSFQVGGYNHARGLHWDRNFTENRLSLYYPPLESAVLSDLIHERFDAARTALRSLDTISGVDGLRAAREALAPHNGFLTVDSFTSSV